MSPRKSFRRPAAFTVGLFVFGVLVEAFAVVTSLGTAPPFGAWFAGFVGVVSVVAAIGLYVRIDRRTG